VDDAYIGPHLIACSENLCLDAEAQMAGLILRSLVFLMKNDDFSRLYEH